jgi:hypothetical protein
MKILQPHKTQYPLVRYGKDNDGGYILADGLDYDLFLSCGIGNDLSFDLMFRKFHPDIEAHAFDGTTLYIDELESGIKYHRICIGANNSETHTNLHDYLSKHKNVFIKMDIEGYERDWIESLPDELLNNIKQLVIEFHGLHVSMPFIWKILKSHTLIHIHANNYGGTIEVNNNAYPNVFECTFLRNDVATFEPYTGALPLPIDMPNNSRNRDIDLNFLTR